KKGKTRKGNKWVKGILARGCRAIVYQKKDCRITEFFQRVKRRQGDAKAGVATIHLYLRIIHHMLSNKIPYEELGEEYMQEQSRQQVSKLMKQLNRLGYAVELTPTTRRCKSRCCHHSSVFTDHTPYVV